jgi:hypothetical protein
MQWLELIKLDQDRVRWRAFLDPVMNLQFLQKQELNDYKLIKEYHAPWS